MKKIFITFVAILAMAFQAHAVNPLEALGNVVNSVTSTDKFEIKSLEGTWTYQSPAITFDSDNALNRAGGAAASAAVESKLAPYYSRLGLSTVKITFDAEGNFTITLKKITIKGTVTKDGDDGRLTFNFQSDSKVKLGKVSAFASKSALGVLTLTFDASHVLAIVEKIASISSNPSLKSLASVLKGYDGVYAGAKFKKGK